jgi:hypothetical protein
MRVIAFLLLLITVTGVALASPRYSITLYEHKDFEGRSLRLTSVTKNLKSTGLNDRISSLKLVLGQKWLLCKNKNFNGGCIVVDRDVPDLEALGFNDTISSLKPVE